MIQQQERVEDGQRDTSKGTQRRMNSFEAPNGRGMTMDKEIPTEACTAPKKNRYRLTLEERKG